MSNVAAAQDEAEDRYFTQVDEGDVRLFTLDQLDAAFNAGLIHENTYLCLEGDSKWLTLAEVAGLGGDEEPVSAQQPVAEQPQAPQVSQVVPAAAYRPPVQAAPAYADPFGAPIVQAAHAQSVPPAYGAGSFNSVAPVNSVAPMVMPRTIPPVIAELDDDMMFVRRKRPLGKILGGVAVLGLAGVAFAVVQSGGVRLPKLNDSVAQASAASLSVSNVNQAEAKPAAPAPVAEAAKPAEAPQAEEPKAEEAKPATADSEQKKGDDRFSEDMKAALLNKDKQSASKKPAKKSARAAVAAKAKSGGKSAKAGGGFKSNGSAYDPLNGKL